MQNLEIDKNTLLSLYWEWRKKYTVVAMLALVDAHSHTLDFRNMVSCCCCQHSKVLLCLGCIFWKYSEFKGRFFFKFQEWFACWFPKFYSFDDVSENFIVNSRRGLIYKCVYSKEISRVKFELKCFRMREFHSISLIDFKLLHFYVFIDNNKMLMTFQNSFRISEKKCRNKFLNKKTKFCISYTFLFIPFYWMPFLALHKM